MNRSCRSGTTRTSRAPTRAPGMLPTTMAMPARYSMLPSRPCSMTPGMAKIMMAMSDVPEARLMGMSKTASISGTMMKPPPTPT